MKEMYYNKSQKDLTEEKIHHLLSENLFMPRNRVIFLIDFDFKAQLHIQLKLFGIKWLLGDYNINAVKGGACMIKSTCRECIYYLIFFNRLSLQWMFHPATIDSAQTAVLIQ